MEQARAASEQKTREIAVSSFCRRSQNLDLFKGLILMEAPLRVILEQDNMTIRKQVILSLGSLSPVSSRPWTRLRNLQAHVDTPSLPILLEIQGMQVLGSLCFH